MTRRHREMTKFLSCGGSLVRSNLLYKAIRTRLCPELMKKLNFSNYKFRASGLPTLMTASRSKSDPLSETTKTYLKGLWIAEVYGREKYDTKNKFTEKGIISEPDSLNLIQEVTGEAFFKNQEHLVNDFIQGTPDIIKLPRIKDIKTSWDIWTFQAVDKDYAEKEYFWQVQGYMWLTGLKLADLVFCLVNTPEEIINDELYKLSFKYPELYYSQELEAKMKRNYIFDDIPAKKRLKNFKFRSSQKKIRMLKKQIKLARAYLNTIKL